MKKRKSVSKHDITRALNNVIQQSLQLTSKVRDLDVLFMELVQFLGKQEEFEEFLDGKYKPKEREPSGGSTPPSKK